MNNYIKLSIKEDALEDMANQQRDQYTKECDWYNKSNCCNAPFLTGTDICSKCLEHADTGCIDCKLYWECINNNKVDHR